MIRAFVEAPAGLAAVSLRLHGGQHCRPPISRMGNKAGFAHVVLAALGLRSGEGAGAYVWAESDPDVRALLRAYPDADMLRRIADIIRGWKDEEPRALWERLRAERKARGPAVEPDEVAAMCWIQRRSAHGKGDGYHPGNETHKIEADAPADACHRLAEYASIVASTHPGGGGFASTAIGRGTVGDPRRPPEAMNVADRFQPLIRAAAPAAEVASGFERVAGWMYVNANSWKGEGDHWKDPSDDVIAQGITVCRSAGGLAGDLERAPSRWPPVAVLATIPDAATLSALLGTPGDLEGVVIYSDPDYRDTTGYADTCREAIPELARGWDAAGATVCISEAEPLPELPGWHACEITGGRRGQKRTFSKQQAEWLTMNREPAHRVATQVSMFGGAA